MAAKKTTAANGTPNLGPDPKGYRKVELRLSGFWKPEKPGDWIEGIVGERIEGKGHDGKENVYYSFIVASDDVKGPFERKDEKGMTQKVPAEAGLRVGISGRTLLAFLHDRVGQPVYIRYRGLGRAKPGQSAPKLYDTFEREES